MKWLKYFAAAIAGNLILYLVFKKYLTVTAASLAPIVAIVLLVWEAFSSRKKENFMQSILSARFSKSDEGGIFKREKASKFDTDMDKVEEAVLLAFSSLPIPFIFLFPGKVKVIASVVICLLAGTICDILLAKRRKEIYRAEQEKIEREEKELEEQKKREELGKWK